MVWTKEMRERQAKVTALSWTPERREAVAKKVSATWLEEKRKRISEKVSKALRGRKKSKPWKEKDFCIRWSGGKPYWHYGGQPLSRLTIETHIGRLLTKDEVAHHKDGDTLNDNIENLQLMSRSAHQSLHDHLNPKRKRKEVINDGPETKTNKE